MDEECQVCVRNFTKVTRKIVKCLYCDYIACTDCVKNYLLTQTIDPHCMNCKHGWNDEFIDSIISKAFRNGELKLHRQNILFDREQSFLPASQAVLTQLRENQARVRELNVLFKACRDQMIEYQREITAIRYGDSGGVTRKEFIRKCPAEGCRGFLSSQWKCGQCEMWVCKDCLEVKNGQDDPEHVCVSSNVETAKLLAKDSRPCPTCGTYIYKISGCNQMYCHCHTAFDFKTGKVETGRIHNPHYYEFIRAGGSAGTREHGDEVCGGLPAVVQVFDIFRKFMVYNEFKKGYNQSTKKEINQHWQEYITKMKQKYDLITEIHNFVTHARIIILGFYRVVNNPEINQDLRFKFLESQITKEQWKQQLFRREKKNKFKNEMYQLYTMFVDVAEEAFRKLVNFEVVDPNLEGSHDPSIGISRFNDFLLHTKGVIKELKKLRKYVNISAKEISKRYSSQVIIIDTPVLIRGRAPNMTTVWQECNFK